MGKQRQLSQEERGDDYLNEARDMVTSEIRTTIGEDDLRTIEEKITYAREMKVGMNRKSGIQKFNHGRKYRKFAQRVYQDAKSISERAYERLRFQPQPGTSLKTSPEDVYRIARSLYRCWLTCKEAFPSSFTQDKWVVDAWNEARLRADPHHKHNLLLQDEEIRCDSMKLLTYMKTMINHVVDSFYEFDFSRTPQSISHNASHAQALLAETTFIYQEFNFGGSPHYPYRHPIIQKVVNISWFQNKDDIGVIFHEYFAPISLEAIALVLTVIECCIDEWSTGTRQESSWKEVHYKINYISHLNSLHDLCTHGPHHEGRDLLRQIQDDLVKAARHAGAIPHPTIGSGKLSINALAAGQGGPSKYDSD